VVDRCDVLVQIIDGRNPLFFYSDDLFEYARVVGKGQFLLIVNKSDLVPEDIRSKWNEFFKAEGIDHCFFTAKEGKIVEGEEEITKNICKVLSPQQLIVLLQQYASEKGVEVGLTGYPNVGKSSVINALIGRKKVGVASMPGKTKHFQTLKLTETVILCDCPGLVFPKVHANRAEMILSGLYPIDTLKDYEEAADLLALRIPKA
jgi:large subunit GTPase 1